MILRHKDNGSGFDYRSDYSAFALRGPLVVAGWGYTTEGKPIPNEVDITGLCMSGQFKSTGTTNNFLADFAQRSDCWPVGPVDLRFDIGRGVWTSPNNEPEVYGQILYHLDKTRPVPVLILDTGTYLRDSGTSGNITGYQSFSGWTNTENIYASGTKLNFRYSSTFARWQTNQDSEVTVLLTGTISGGEWDRNITGIKPYRFAMPSFGVYTNDNPDGVGNGSGWLTYRTGNMVTGWNRFTDLITVAAGQGKIAKINNGWLDNGSCRDVTL